MITLYRVNLPAYSEKLWDVQTKGLPSSCLKRVSAEEMVFDSTPDFNLKIPSLVFLYPKKVFT